jgi:N-methylhydantoinase B/oxoprolinase/acetone carboxylase alpha subunit
VDGAVNANLAVTTMYVFRCLVREEIPFASRIARPIRIVASESSIVNARPPAAMAAGNAETSQRTAEVIRAH